MYSVDIASWLKTATEKIRFRRDRIAVREELRQHIEEKWEDLREQGIPEKEIDQRILKDMGSAKELAPLLAEIHKPYWGYAMVILKWVMIAILVITFFAAKDDFSQLFSRTEDDRFTATENGHFSRMYMVEPDTSFTCDNYKFTVQKAALWETGHSVNINGEYFNIRYALYLEIKMMKYPFHPSFQGWEYFWAEDDQGNIYRSRKSPHTLDANGYIEHIGTDNQLFYDIVTIYVRVIREPNTKWIDLHFDADGRDVTVRIDLTGGDRP